MLGQAGGQGGAAPPTLKVGRAGERWVADGGPSVHLPFTVCPLDALPARQLKDGRCSFWAGSVLIIVCALQCMDRWGHAGKRHGGGMQGEWRSRPRTAP